MKDDKKFKEKFAKAAAKHLWKDSKYPLEVKMKADRGNWYEENGTIFLLDEDFHLIRKVKE